MENSTILDEDEHNSVCSSFGWRNAYILSKRARGNGFKLLESRAGIYNRKTFLIIRTHCLRKLWHLLHRRFSRRDWIGICLAWFRDHACARCLSRWPLMSLPSIPMILWLSVTLFYPSFSIMGDRCLLSGGAPAEAASCTSGSSGAGEHLQKLPAVAVVGTVLPGGAHAPPWPPYQSPVFSITLSKPPGI